MHCHQVNKSFREINLGSFWEPVNTLRKEKTTKYTDRKTKKVAVNFTWKTHGTNGYHQDCPHHMLFLSFVKNMAIRLFYKIFLFFIYVMAKNISYYSFAICLRSYAAPFFYGVCNLSFIVLGRRENRLNFGLGTYTFRRCHLGDYVFIALNFSNFMRIKKLMFLW